MSPTLKRGGWASGAVLNPVNWSPKELGSSLKLWLRSDMGITKDGSNRVGTWADQSGTGSDFSQSTDDNKPVWTAGAVAGLPGIRFDGSNDVLIGPVASTLMAVNAKSLAIAISNAGYNSTDREIVRTTGGAYFKMGIASANDYQLVNYDVDTDAAHVAGTTGVHILIGTHNGTALSLQVDNGSAGAPNSGNTGSLAGTLQLGSATTAFAGDICEVIVANIVWSSDQIAAVYRYLARRYGIN